MTKQKKAIISLSVVSAVILIALVTVVAVWAATSQTVTSQLTVRYSATNVTADVTAEYKLAGASSYTTIGSTSFAATDSTQTKSVNAEEISLSDTATSVLFRYTFENKGGNAITVSLNDGAAVTNMTVTYAQTDSAETAATAVTGEELNSFDIEGGETAYVYINVQITSQASDASYNGTLTWNLANKAA